MRNVLKNRRQVLTMIGWEGSKILMAGGLMLSTYEMWGGWAALFCLGMMGQYTRMVDAVRGSEPLRELLKAAAEEAPGPPEPTRPVNRASNLRMSS